MFLNEKPSASLALLATIDPVSQAAGTVSTAWVDLATYFAALAILSVGAFGVAATVDAKLQQATDAAGTGAKDISGKAITQLLAAGGNNRQIMINMKSADLDTENAFRFLRLTVTVGATATLIAAGLFGAIPHYAVVSNQVGVAQVI